MMMTDADFFLKACEIQFNIDGGMDECHDWVILNSVDLEDKMDDGNDLERGLRLIFCDKIAVNIILFYAIQRIGFNPVPEIFN